MTAYAPEPDVDLHVLMFALLGFSLGLVAFFFSRPHSSLLERECLLCAIVYWKCVIFSFYRGSKLRVCLKSQRKL
jgi:hypothetical protein